MATTPITPELIAAALPYIPPDLPYEEWTAVAMGIKHECPGDAGREMFISWCQTAQKYDPIDTRSKWAGISAAGGRTGATVLAMAKARGFDLAAWHRANTQAPALSPAQQRQADAERSRQRAANQAAELARKNAAQAAAAIEAAAQWQAASETGSSPYLERKAVQPHGLRFAPDGWLLVPLRDAGGELLNLQRIAPTPPEAGPDKLFLKGGRVTGLFHRLHSAAAPADSGSPVVLIAEGYATAASLHQATGYPVAMACHAGNLGAVARALRELHPAALIVVCGDDDQATQERTGSNPGRDKATAAARAVRGLAVFPEGLPAGASDFNDLHQAAGLDAVRATVAAAIDAHQATAATTAEPAPVATAAPLAKPSRKRPGTRQDQGNDNQGTSRNTSHDQAPATGHTLDRFHVDDDGVWHTPPGDDGGMPRKICGPLRVTGLARDGSDNQAALLLEFDTPYRSGRRWLMPLAMLAGDGAAFRSALLSQGFMTPTDAKRRGLLTEYLQSRTPAELVRHVPRVGWHGRCYVLPEETLGTNPAGDRVIFHSEAGIEARFSQRGTLAKWQHDLARLCIGNSRFAFAAATAFAGPLLAWASGMTGGGFQLIGPTSIGKTTAFLIAASVWGRGTESDPESYIQKWRGTSNGFEYLGEQHNDSTLILDEMGQIDPVEAGQVCYMMADGAGKSRAKAGGGLRQKPTWRTLLLSSGEVSLEQHMRTAGKAMKGGQEVRLIPIPAEVIPGSAAETNHEFDGGHALSGWVKQHAARCYGTAGRAWLEYLVANTEGLTAALRERMDAIETAIVSDRAAGQVQRGGRRFALVAAAGEMATDAGLTGWPAGEATRAARACYEAWIQSRGGSGSSEITSMLRQVRRFLEQHGEGRFTMWHRAADDHAPKTLNRAGFRRMINAEGEPIKTNSQFGSEYGDRMPATLGEGVSFEYFVLQETFKAEVCQGFDAQTVARVLRDHGCLHVETGRLTFSTELPGIGKNTRCYRITPGLFELDI